ncbi:hypothetical protein EBR56_10640, partial [bacterium]|nr:hypothetical protein [bacterium]
MARGHGVRRPADRRRDRGGRGSAGCGTGREPADGGGIGFWRRPILDSGLDSLAHGPAGARGPAAHRDRRRSAAGRASRARRPERRGGWSRLADRPHAGRGEQRAA